MTNMDAGDWITLVAVIVALSIGVTSIRQTRNIRQQEYKNRLINDVILWAGEVSRCSLGPNEPAITQIRASVERFLRTPPGPGVEPSEATRAWQGLKVDFDIDRICEAGMTSLDLMALDTRNQYIKNISGSLGRQLEKTVELLIVHIDAHKRLLDRVVKNPSKREITRVTAHEPYLTKFAANVTNEACKLQSKYNI